VDKLEDARNGLVCGSYDMGLSHGNSRGNTDEKKNLLKINPYPTNVENSVSS